MNFRHKSSVMAPYLWLIGLLVAALIGTAAMANGPEVDVLLFVLISLLGCATVFFAYAYTCYMRSCPDTLRSVTTWTQQKDDSDAG